MHASNANGSSQGQHLSPALAARVFPSQLLGGMWESYSHVCPPKTCINTFCPVSFFAHLPIFLLVVANPLSHSSPALIRVYHLICSLNLIADCTVNSSDLLKNSAKVKNLKFIVLISWPVSRQPFFSLPITLNMLMGVLDRSRKWNKNWPSETFKRNWSGKIQSQIKYHQINYIGICGNNMAKVISSYPMLVKTYVSLRLRVQNAVSRSTLCWKIPNISGSIELFAL